MVDQNAGRPARQIQWSAGFQREIIKDLLVDVAYVGNRGAWWLSSILDNYNALTPQILTANGLDINSATDRAILRAQIGSSAAGTFPEQAAVRRIPADLNRRAGSAAVPAVLERPGPAVGAQGRTWYDSLQTKVTKRYSHGLIVDYAFTWAKEEQLGVEAGTVNDYQNRLQNKSISGFSRPLVSVISANYTSSQIGEEQSRLAGSPRLDYRRGDELCQRLAHSCAHFDQQSEYAVVPLHHSSTAYRACLFTSPI